MNEPEPQDQLEAKVISAPRRVWTKIELVARAERRKMRDQAAILLLEWADSQPTADVAA